MNDVIKQINRVDSEENDFIYSNGIKISKYLKLEVQNANRRDQY